MTDDLHQVHTEAWDSLSLAVANPDCAFQYLTLSTVVINKLADDNSTNHQPQPHARLLVLRNCSRQKYHLEFHTDIRSPKWHQLQKNSAASVTGYDPIQRLQIRMQGTITLLDPQTDENKTAWSALSKWTKHTYCGHPPGDTLQTTSQATQLTDEDVAYGQGRFGVLLFKAQSLDWFQLERGNNRRAFFNYADDSNELTSDWITP